MIIATFNSTTDWDGRSIEYDGHVFTVAGVAQITVDEVMLFDADGQLTWVSAETRDFIATSVPAAQPVGAPPEVSTNDPKRMLIATFGPTTAWVGKTITFENEVFQLEGHGPISAADVMEYDRQGHLIWVNDGMRAWVGSNARSPLQSTDATARTPTSMASPADQATGATAAASGRQTQPARAFSKRWLLLAALGLIVLVAVAVFVVVTRDDAGAKSAASTQVLRNAVPASPSAGSGEQGSTTESAPGAIGDPYGGGAIACIDGIGVHGLIAAAADQTPADDGIRWATEPNCETAVPGALGTAIGTGAANTDATIARNDAGTSYAAGLAQAYNGGGYSD
jgi:hypothetical protein